MGNSTNFALPSHLLFLENTLGVETISSYRYALDPVGNRISVEEINGRRVEYAYDSLYRLLSESITDPLHGNRLIEYTFDPVGNRLIRNDTQEGISSYIYNDNDQLLSETTTGVTTQYTYDNSGNIITEFRDSENQVTYQWDSQNRLKSAEIIESERIINIEFLYNSDGIRIAKIIDGIETNFLVDDNQSLPQVVEEYSSLGEILASYIYGLDLISQRQKNEQIFYHIDGLGSTRQILSLGGTILNQYTYEAYGDLVGTGSLRGDTELKALLYKVFTGLASKTRKYRLCKGLRCFITR